MILACAAILIFVSVWTPPISILGIQPLRAGQTPLGGPLGDRARLEDLLSQSLTGWDRILMALATFVVLYLSGIVTLLLVPRRIRNIADEFRGDWPSKIRLLFVGFLGILSVLALALLGLFAIAGAPISVAMLILVFLAVWMGSVALAFEFGGWLIRMIGAERPSALVSFGLGLLVIEAAALIPIAGWAVTAVVIFLAAGSSLFSKFGTGGSWSLKELSER
jgi:hypothetical protein